MKQPKRSLRAVNTGTRYDITGNLRRVTRKLESEPSLMPQDVLMVTRTHDGTIEAFHWGTGDIPTVHYMASVAAERLRVVPE